MKNWKFIISLAILVIFYTVGYFGMTGDDPDYFASLTPVTLILSSILLAVNHQNFKKVDLTIVLIAGVVGFFMEVLGVYTGQIFGEYYYGDSLGVQWLNVPLTMALNWAILIYCTMAIASAITKNWFLKSVIGSALMVLMDIPMEPIAIRFDFWHWPSREIPAPESVPLQNYVAWFVIALVIHLVANKLRPDFKNKFGIVLFIVMFLFFTLLNFAI